MATTLVASILPMQAFALTPELEPRIFDDVDENHENLKAIEYLANEGVVQGYKDGFKPERTISRGEFLKIGMESSAAYEDKTFLENKFYDDCFEDSMGHWAERYICKAYEDNVVKGFNPQEFKPDDPINFVEASKIVANLLDLEVGEEGDEWYDKYLDALEAKDAIPDSLNGLSKDITRGEMSEIVWRVKERPEGVTTISVGRLKNREKVKEKPGQLVQFASCSDFESYMRDNTWIPGPYIDMPMAKSLSAGIVMEEAMESAPAAESNAAPADDFSTTNIQVAGVDEADIIKNDGKYIYIVKGETVRIVEAYPGEELKELSVVEFNDEQFLPGEVYLDGDQLTVLGHVWENYERAAKVYVLDIEDRSDVEVDREISFESEIMNSRKVGDQLYLVLNDVFRPANYDWLNDEPLGEDMLPKYTEDDKTRSLVSCDDVWYYAGGHQTNMNAVVALDLDENSGLNAEVLVGVDGQVYASRNNLYIAEYANNFRFWGWGPRQGIIEPEVVKEETLVHRFELNEGELSYEGRGVVPGRILNQFSMDEYDGHFRIATTVGDIWNSETKSTNNVYVLNQDLEVVGEVEGIAPGERIYSVRFMGKKAYIVTFKKVDPFFVLDMEDHTNPTILGELKIPGYSDYLHPFGDNYVIGFGKDTVEAEVDDKSRRNMDFAWYQGLKVAMFDVTDVKNPKELHKMIIGDRGTDSEMLYNHKALLFNEDKGLMAFPIQVYLIPEEKKEAGEVEGNTYGERVFFGAHVYSVSVEDGFELQKAITHEEPDEEYGWMGMDPISRILYIGKYLYTVSELEVRSHDMEENYEEVEAVELLQLEDDFVYGYPEYEF
jgi:uncharacterized secreted protein with C-terminal beta-propeller domain